MQKQKLISLIFVLLVLIPLASLPFAASESAPLGGDSWPMFHQNLNRTGTAASANAANSARLLWGFTTNASVSSSPAVADGCVFVGSKDGSIYCLNASSGQKVWIWSTGDEVICSPAVADGRVFVGSDDGWFYCLNSSTGTPLWIEWIGWNQMWTPRSSPAVWGGCVYVGSGNHDFFCFNASDGSTIWKYETSRAIMTSPALSDGVLFFGSSDFYLYALNASTGKELWRTPTGSDASSPCVDGGCVYIGSAHGYLYCLNVSTGAFLWGFQTADSITSSPAVAAGCVYVGSQDNSIYCINASNGHRIWQTATGYWVCSSPAIADGNLYVGSEDYSIYCLNASTGAVKWCIPTGSYVDSSPAVVDGVLYVGSHDHQLYAFELVNSTGETLTVSFPPLPWTTIVFDAIACGVGCIIIAATLRYIQTTRRAKRDDPANASNSWFRRHADALCLLVIAGFSITFYLNLGEFLWVSDEQAYSQMAYHMVKTGDYLTPSTYGELGIWTGKPPMLMWLMSLSYQAFGVTNFATRFFVPIFGALSLLFVFYLGKKLYNRTVGLLSALVLGTFTTFYSFATHAMIDVPLTCFILGSLYFFILSMDGGKTAIRYAALGGVCFGLAFLTKQTGALLIPAILIIYLVASKRSVRAFAAKPFAVFLGVGLLVAAPWLVYMNFRFGSDFWNCYFLYNAFTRASNPLEGHMGGYLYYFQFLATGETLVWAVLLPFAVGLCAYLAFRRSKADVLVVSWVAVVLLVFTVAQTKIPYYILPAYPAFALAIGSLLYQLSKKIIRLKLS